MISKGIMGGLSGNPADIIVIDDPIKNRQEAESKTYRDRIWEEFLNSIYTRLSANGVIVLIMTRWNLDDLAGRLLANMPEKCFEINIPLEAEANDILGRNVGDALFPEIGKNNEWLQEFKKVYQTDEGLKSWNALMQGRPVAQEGNMIKRDWFKFYDVLPKKFDEILQSWDLTFKDSDGSDYVVGQVWGRVGIDKYLIDQVRDRMSFTMTLKAIMALSEKHPLAYIKLIEDKANGSAVIDTLRQIGGIIPIVPKESKLARVSAISPDIEAGNVWLPRFGSFTSEFIEEACSFPSGIHDDMVDTMSQALNRMKFHFTEVFNQRELPKGLPEDLVQDLMDSPLAMEHYLRKNHLIEEPIIIDASIIEEIINEEEKGI